MPLDPYREWGFQQDAGRPAVVSDDGERQEAEMDEVLHALGIKGRASLEEVAAVLGNMPSPTEQCLVTSRAEIRPAEPAA
jgi:hypothetical protein